MKRILTNFLNIAGIALVMLSSCKKNDPVITSDGGKAGALTADKTTLVLDATKLTDTSKIINFSFTPPQYSFDAAVTNTIQIDADGDNWVKPASATLSAKIYKQGYSTADFNNLLLKLNLTGGVASKVQVRVQHALSTTVASYSNVISLTVTPFNLKTFLYAVGGFQGWNINNCDSLISATSNGIYTGIFYFPPGSPDFLIVPKKGSYDNKYATNDATNTTSATVAQNGPNNFFSPAGGGTYQVTLNLNNNTISFATPAIYYSIIGDVTPGGNFSTDIDLSYINNGGDTQTWTGTFTLPAGTFKFRQSHDWTYSWGVPKAGSEGAGIANTLNDSSNDNIPLAAAGTYKITFTIPPGVGTTPSVTATYTAVKQ